MSQRVLAAGAAALIAAAFLLGFVPQYSKARNLGSRAATMERQIEYDELALSAAYVYLHTNMKNYGLAAQTATRLFEKMNALAVREEDPGRKKYIQSALGQRDVVTSALAKGDPDVLGRVQSLFQGALESSGLSQK